MLFLRSKEEFNLKLIIAEKPSVALAIAKALNIKGSRGGYIENGEYYSMQIFLFGAAFFRVRLPRPAGAKPAHLLPVCDIRWKQADMFLQKTHGIKHYFRSDRRLVMLPAALDAV